MTQGNDPVVLLEAKVKVLGLDVLILLGGFGFKVDGVALNVNGFDGADVLATAASYAELGGGLRDGKAALKRYHVDSLNGAVFCAGTAAGTVHIDYAYILVEYNATRLCAVFLFNREGLYCTGGADLAAQVAVIVAVAVIKFHYRLHKAAQAILYACGFKYMAGAFAYAQMAGSAVLQQVPVAYGAWRRHGYTLIFFTCYLGLKCGRSKGGYYQC